MVTKENIKDIVEAMSNDVRGLSWNMKLSFLESPTTIQTVPAKKTQIIIVWHFDNDWDDLNVAKKAMTQNISNKLWLNLSHSEINNLFK